MASSRKCVSFLFALLFLLPRVSEAEDPLEVDPGKPVPVWGLDFSPDGSLLAAVGGEREGGGVLKLWNTLNWTCVLAVPEDRALTCVAFSPDGQRLAVGTQKGQFAIFDISSRQTTAFWESGKWSVYGVTWSHDGKRVVGACANGVIKVWDAKTQELQITFDVWQADGIADPGLRGNGDRNQWDVALSADGKTLLSAGWNDTTRLWSMETHKLIHEFGEEDKSPQGVKLLPDEKHFVSAGTLQGRVRIRETKSFRERMTLPVIGRDLAVHPNGAWIAACSQTDVQVYRVDLDVPTPADTLRARAFVGELANQDPNVRTRAVSSLRKMGSRVEPVLYEVMQSKPDLITKQLQELWEQLHTPQEIAILTETQGEVRQVVFSPTGQLLAAATITGHLQVWNVPEFSPLRQFKVTSLRLPEQNVENE